MMIDDEFKALIPPLSDEERALLEQSLLNEGCRDSLVVWRDTLIDGHNRYELCQKHGVAFKTVERDFQDRNEALAWIIQNQLGRRNIADYTRGRLALRLEGVLKANGKANMSNGGKGFSNLRNLVDTHAEMAKAADLSKGTIYKVKAIETDAPAVIKQAAEKEEISIHKAYELTRALEIVKEANPKFYEETIARGHLLDLDGHDVPLTQADPTLIRVMSNEDDYERTMRWKTHKQNGKQQEAERRLEAAKTPLPVGKYRCIVIDPPYPMQKIEREERPKQGAYLDYPTMELEAIAALPIADLADVEGCHLYVWTTQKFLPDTLKLIEAWGFRYQCLMTWVKPTGMTPYSWMYNTEFVVFARVGNLPLTRNGLKLSFEAASNGHSVKPTIFYDRVLSASPEPRLEMFARQSREGFSVWGNEVHEK